MSFNYTPAPEEVVRLGWIAVVGIQASLLLIPRPLYAAGIGAIGFGAATYWVTGEAGGDMGGLSQLIETPIWAGIGALAGWLTAKGIQLINGEPKDLNTGFRFWTWLRLGIAIPLFLLCIRGWRDILNERAVVIYQVSGTAADKKLVIQYQSAPDNYATLDSQEEIAPSQLPWTKTVRLREGSVAALEMSDDCCTKGRLTLSITINGKTHKHRVSPNYIRDGMEQRIPDRSK